MNDKASHWSNRAGVILGYQPEDTMKSLLFEEHNRHCLRSLPKNESDRILDLLSSDDDSDSDSFQNTKDAVGTGEGGGGDYEEESCAELGVPGDMIENPDQKTESSGENCENDSTWADLSTDLGEPDHDLDFVITASNKSFEEILENKLQQDKSDKNYNVTSKPNPSSKPKFTFLRKNSGKAAWCSKAKASSSNSSAKSLSTGRGEVSKICSEKEPSRTGLRRMKSMPPVSKDKELKSITSDLKATKNVQKFVHFAERSDHETSTETLDTVRSFKVDKTFNKKKNEKDNHETQVNEEMDKDLVEFELLEQIANVSMSSTASSIARFDEDMLRERVLKIQKMPPPNIRFQKQYLDDSKAQEMNSHPKLTSPSELVEEVQVHSAYISDQETESEVSFANSTSLSQYKEIISSHPDTALLSNPQKTNPTRKISKQNNRKRLMDPSIASDNDESWIEESPFHLTDQKSERLLQTQNNSIHNLPPVNWSFADPFQQSDLSSDEEFSKVTEQSQPKGCIEIKNIFPNICVDKKQANPEDNISVQSAKLKQWVQLLENEIKRFNKENEEIAKIKSEQENGLKRLENEMNEFSKHKDEEMKVFEEFKQKEIKRLKKDRKVFEEYQEAMKNMPNKKDREEIDKLKMEIQSLKEEAVNKESRWQAANTRCKQKIEQLESENAEMHSRIHSLEQKRLQLQAQLISYSSQTAPTKSTDHASVRPKTTVTAVAQAISQKHTINPIGGGPTKDDNNNNRFQGHKPGTKITNTSSTKAVKAPKKVDPCQKNVGRVDVRGSAASDYYTGEEETGSVDSHQNGTSEVTSTMRDNGSLLKGVPYAMKINRSNDPIKEELCHQDGIVERIYRSGAIDVHYPNGSLKQISGDGKSVIIHLFNGDVKQMTPDGRVVYFYSHDGSTQTTFSDGSEEILYKNGQKELSFPSGIREIHFPDKSIKILHPDSREENILPNGLIIRLNGSGDKEIILPNGQKEIHSNGIKKRIYPDGTTKTVYPDGRQETYYASGRMRVKDINGQLILDQYIEKVVPASSQLNGTTAGVGVAML